MPNMISPFSFHQSPPHRDLHSFPTRRSSDLAPGIENLEPLPVQRVERMGDNHKTRRVTGSNGIMPRPSAPLDRKSTRLNSSHITISYAVFCLKKKKKTKKDNNT